MLNMLMRFFKNEEGQAMTEYGLIIVVVALVAVVGLGFMGNDLNTLFDGIDLTP